MSPTKKRIQYMKALFVVSLLCASQAVAGLLMEERFDYADGALKGLKGGIGFTSEGWSNTSNWTVENKAAVITANGSANSARNFVSALTAEANASFYFSFTITPESYTVAGFNDYLVFRSGTTQVFSIGSISDSWGYRLNINAGGANTQLTTGTTTPAGEAITVVGKFTFDDGRGKALLSVWINPSSESDLAKTATWTSSVSSLTNIMLSRQDNSSVANTIQSFDDIRIGTDWKSVTVSQIPEPKVFTMLAGVLMVGLAFWLRRSAK